MNDVSRRVWVRATNDRDALRYAANPKVRYESREDAERIEPGHIQHTYEVLVVDHGFIPEPIWWVVSWNTSRGWDVDPSYIDGQELRFEQDATFCSAFIRLLAITKDDARTKAIEAWGEAGFLGSLQRAGLEVL